MNRNAAYGASERYLDAQGKNYFAYQRSIAEANGELLARKFESYIRPEDCVLDFGCGGGYLLKALNCAHKVGVEINPAALQEAAKSGIACNSVLDTVGDGIADVIVSNHALEHVPFPIEALRQLKRKLKRGGALVLCVPIDDWRTQKRYNPQDLNHHLHTWTPLALGHTLHEAGFRVHDADLAVITHAWPPRVHALSKLLPRGIFDFICRLFAIAMKRRQLLAVVRND
jgi:2-polyprenyl-3-methyl-5-hydroxy-6-metoxy-1,4-benzoquinol methylase